MNKEIVSKIALTENQRIELNELFLNLLDNKQHLTFDQVVALTSLKNQLNQYWQHQRKRGNMKIISVQKFNQEMDQRYKNRVSSFEYGKDGFPYRFMFVFQTPEGQDRSRGFVAIPKEDSYHFFLTRKELNNFLNTR